MERTLLAERRLGMSLASGGGEKEIAEGGWHSLGEEFGFYPKRRALKGVVCIFIQPGRMGTDPEWTPWEAGRPGRRFTEVRETGGAS